MLEVVGPYLTFTCKTWMSTTFWAMLDLLCRIFHVTEVFDQGKNNLLRSVFDVLRPILSIVGRYPSFIFFLLVDNMVIKQFFPFFKTDKAKQIQCLLIQKIILKYFLYDMDKINLKKIKFKMLKKNYEWGNFNGSAGVHQTNQMNI